MLDRMRIPASRENLAPPLLVGNLLVVHVPVEDTREGTDDFPDGVGASDYGICGSRGPLGAGEQTHGNPRNVFGRDQRQNGAFIAKGRRMAPRVGMLAPTRRA